MKPHEGIPRFLEFFKPAIIDVIMDTGPLFGPDGKPFDVEVYMPIAVAEAIAAAERASTVGVGEEYDPGGGGHGGQRGYNGYGGGDERRDLGGGSGQDGRKPKLDGRSIHDGRSGHDGRSSHGKRSAQDGQSDRSARHQRTSFEADPKPPDQPGDISGSPRSHRASSPYPRSSRDERSGYDGRSCYAGRSSGDGRSAPGGRSIVEGRSSHGRRSGHDASNRCTSLEADSKPSDHTKDACASPQSRSDTMPHQKSLYDKPSCHNERSAHYERQRRTSLESDTNPPNRPRDNSGSRPSRPDISSHERGGHGEEMSLKGQSIQDSRDPGGGRYSSGVQSANGRRASYERKSEQEVRASGGRGIEDGRIGHDKRRGHQEQPRRIPLESDPKLPEHPGDVSGSLPSPPNSSPYERSGHVGLGSSKGKSVQDRGDPGGDGGRDSSGRESVNRGRVSHAGRCGLDGGSGPEEGRSHQGQGMTDGRDSGGGQYNPGGQSANGRPTSYEGRDPGGGRPSVDTQNGVDLESPVHRDGTEDKMLDDWKIRELDAACKPCRAGNIPLCDGSKPSCSNCQAFGGTCHYSRLGPLRSSISKIKTLVAPLRSRNGTNSKASALRSVSPAPSSCSGYAEYGEYGERGKYGEYGDKRSDDGREPEGKAPKSRLHSALARIGSALISKSGSKGKKKGVNGTGRLNGRSSHDSHFSSPSSSVGTTPSSQASSLSSLSSTSYDLSGESTPTPRAPPLYQPQRPPEPFQCTDCLTRCQLKQAWKDHESSHYPLKHLVQSNSKVRSNFFWNCGFCDYMSTQWEERLEHIGEHYAQGMTMGEWDPRRSPAPLYRKTLLPVPECEPLWHISDLLAMQRLANNENKPCKYSQITPINCDYCNVYFSRPEQLSRHLELYHSDTPLENWACPALPDKMDKFFRQAEKKNREYDVCQCCGMHFKGLDFEERRVHLMGEDEHNFGSCRCAGGEKFWNKPQFMAHLANRHMFILGEGSKDFVDRDCKEKADPLAVEIRRMEQAKMRVSNV